MENQKEIGKPQAYFLNATVKWLLFSPVGFQKGLADHFQETENSVYVYVWCMGYVRLGLPLRRKTVHLEQCIYFVFEFGEIQISFSLCWLITLEGSSWQRAALGHCIS